MDITPFDHPEHYAFLRDAYEVLWAILHHEPAPSWVTAPCDFAPLWLELSDTPQYQSDHLRIAKLGSDLVQQWHLWRFHAWQWVARIRRLERYASHPSCWYLVYDAIPFEDYCLSGPALMRESLTNAATEMLSMVADRLGVQWHLLPQWNFAAKVSEGVQNYRLEYMTKILYRHGRVYDDMFMRHLYLLDGVAYKLRQQGRFGCTQSTGTPLLGLQNPTLQTENIRQLLIAQQCIDALSVMVRKLYTQGMGGLESLTH